MDDNLMKLLQDRKGVSIAFFNATNSAIAMVANMKFENSADALKTVFMLRDSFIEEYKTYYANVIANMGANYKAEDAIKKLEGANSYDTLNKVWLMLSEDERRDGEIRKVAQAMKTKLKK